MFLLFRLLEILFLTNSELDSDNSLLNTELFFIDFKNVNGKKWLKAFPQFPNRLNKLTNYKKHSNNLIKDTIQRMKTFKNSS